jgi:hypothetical protein
MAPLRYALYLGTVPYSAVQGVAVGSTKIVHLGQVRDLLAEWEQVRQAILAGQVDGFHTALRRGTAETIYLGGVYKEDPHAAARAVLRVSIAHMLAEDELLPSANTNTQKESACATNDSDCHLGGGVRRAANTDGASRGCV